MVPKEPVPQRNLAEWVNDLHKLMSTPIERPDEALSDRRAKAVRRVLDDSARHLGSLSRGLDPIRMPGRVFNPSDPKVFGPFISLALLAQPRVKLETLEPCYGSGVYAIYYNGAFDAYAPITRVEHPIYVGKADPEDAKAENPKDQGDKLTGRLLEHRTSIFRASNLDVADFECRYMVISSGWQDSVEKFLIKVYAPIWNKETKICFGIGKHGDSAATRGNKRSPWDTLHAGRGWAAATEEDQASEIDIRKKLEKHFHDKPPIQSLGDAFERFLQEFRSENPA